MYDIIIIGAGPAGLTAGIYTTRAGLKTLILEKETIGGQISSSPLVENYPGFKKISGSELANELYDQVINLGAELEIEEVIKIIPGKIHEVITDNNKYKCKSIIVATGAKYRLLSLANEIELIGNGIHFCVACDGAFYKGKVVAVIGGGNSAVINALALSDICKKVYIIQNLDKLTAESTLQAKITKKENVEIIFNTIVNKIIGENDLEEIIIHNSVDKHLKIDGMFISIGLIPESSIVKDILPINKYNYIVSDNGTTNLDGIFVAGDCRDKKIKQLTVATSDGTIAALEAINYIDSKEEE